MYVITAGDIAPRQIRHPPQPEPRGARRLEQIVQPRRGAAALRHLAEVRIAEGGSVITYNSPLNALKDTYKAEEPLRRRLVYFDGRLTIKVYY